ncbi:MAG TPA: hypothetical protein VHT05_14195 [Candidatus Elarobacter sp.]|jgi:hypothetical protein|nr:hypothetical protein [Candidatus Elarobacter sp.]
MNRTVARIATGVVVAWGVLGAAAAGQTATPAPSPSAAPSPAAFIARAHADATFTRDGNAGGARADIAIYQHAALTRIDLLSLTSSTLPIPPLHFTAVLDGRAHTVTVWNDATKRYFVSHVAIGALPTPAPKATKAPGWLFDRRSPFADLDVLEFTFKMTGHTTTAGLATTGFAGEMTIATKKSKNPLHVSSTAQLSDDYGGFPVAASIVFEPPAGLTRLGFDYAIDAVSVTQPPDSAFRMPRGYTKATSAFAVIFSSGATPAPSPSPTASVTPSR